MFSRVRRGSRAKAIIYNDTPSSPAQGSARSVSPALASPLLPWADSVRPASADGLSRQRIGSSGPPILPPIPRVGGELDDNDSFLKLDFSQPFTVDATPPSKSYEHFSRPRSAASPASKDFPPRIDSSVRNTLALRGATASPILTTVVTHDTATTATQPRGRVGRAVSGPTMVLSPVSGRMSEDTPPRMEASVFPSYGSASPLSLQLNDEPPLMDRKFIDSRDKPYSQPRPGNAGSSRQLHNLKSSSTVDLTKLPPTISSPTIGISFESTSAAFPAPQLVTTRPKTQGSMSTVAGVQVPTHHTSSVRPAETSTNKDRRMTRLLNPISLLGRKKASPDAIVVGDEERRALTQAQARQKTVATAGIDRLPDDFDPRIRGKIVHDFSAPRQRMASPIPSPAPYSPTMPGPATQEHRKSTHTPVFFEHLGEDRHANVNAEGRENKDFLARCSQQSARSTFSQESAILPPFARRSQNLDTTQSAWHDDAASWSSDRDSVVISDTGLATRGSGISSFSAVSPITQDADNTQVFSSFFAQPHVQNQNVTTDTITTHSNGIVPKQKSNASRFSFQLSSEGVKEERALESRFTPVPIDDEDDDYFDEDAIDDMDEIEMQMQHADGTTPTISPPAVSTMHNERDLTYAEHTVIRSAFLDDYVGAASTLPPRKSSILTVPPAIQDPVDSALGSFRFSDTADGQISLGRADSDTKDGPRWDRTANLWQAYGPGNEPSAHAVSADVAANDDILATASASTGEARPIALASIEQQGEDLYYDDGQFEEESEHAAEMSTTNEADIDRLPVPDRGQKDYTQQRNLAITTTLPQRYSSLQPVLDEDKTSQYMPAVLEAYHQALADAANRAAAEGRFARQPSLVQDTAVPNSTSPSKMAFDFGFDAISEHDQWDQDLEDDDIVAAANAEALANDDDGFYGSEFGFYAHARTDAGAEVKAINGGFFGEDGDDGLTRKRSVKEPNLTPITERSEFSNRNSFVNLVGLVSGTPTLSRMSIDAFGENDITTFEQLMKLRKNAFGGSSASLGSQQRASPTGQHFPAPLITAYSTGSSSSGDRMTAAESPLHAESSQREAPRLHSRTGSGTDSVTYVREEGNGQPRWIIERRRLSPTGQIEVAREAVSDGWI